MPSLAPELFIHADRNALGRAAADKFVELANEAIAARGRFAVALSGGSTPREMYQQLASDAYRARVDWRRVYFFWGDERTVPPASPDSNFRMANETLLSRIAVPRENIHRIRAEENPDVAASEYERTLRAFFGDQLPRFDLVLLGLGSNGHTASLFPRTPALHENARWCVAVWVPELDTQRITLTAPLINHAANIIFLVAGRDKAAVLREVLRGPYEPERLPAQFIRPDDGKLMWMLDQDAASESGI
jgi:6-phosphogluconolactonase